MRLDLSDGTSLFFDACLAVSRLDFRVRSSMKVSCSDAWSHSETHS